MLSKFLNEMDKLGFISAIVVVLLLVLVLYIACKEENTRNSSRKLDRLEYDNDEYDYGHNVNHDETDIS